MIDLGDWKEPLAPLFEDERYKKIRAFLIEEYRHHTVYPDMYDIYNCFRYHPLRKGEGGACWGRTPITTKGRRTGCAFPFGRAFPSRPRWKI